MARRSEVAGACCRFGVRIGRNGVVRGALWGRFGGAFFAVCRRAIRPSAGLAMSWGNEVSPYVFPCSIADDANVSDAKYERRVRFVRAGRHRFRAADAAGLGGAEDDALEHVGRD